MIALIEKYNKSSVFKYPSLIISPILRATALIQGIWCALKHSIFANPTNRYRDTSMSREEEVPIQTEYTYVRGIINKIEALLIQILSCSDRRISISNI